MAGGGGPVAKAERNSREPPAERTTKHMPGKIEKPALEQGRLLNSCRTKMGTSMILRFFKRIQVKAGGGEGPICAGSDHLLI